MSAPLNSRPSIERHWLVFGVVLVLAAVTFVKAGAGWTAALVTVGFSLYTAASPKGDWQAPSTPSTTASAAATAAPVLAAGLLWCTIAWGSSYFIGAFEHSKVAPFAALLPVIVFAIYMFIRCVGFVFCGQTHDSVGTSVPSIHTLSCLASACLGWVLR
jgi:hypothetical protein